MQNGERINFGPNVNFIFETDSLKFASLATISRNGIIYMNQEDLDIKSVVNSWIGKQKENLKPNLINLFENYFFEIFKNITNEQTLMLKTTNFGTIYNFLSLCSDIESKGMFVDCLIRGLGANLSIEARKKFALEVFQLAGERPDNMKNPLNNYYDTNYRCFKSYTLMVDSAIELKSFNNLRNNPLVKTLSIQRDLDILNRWLVTNEQPFIVVGPEGCGKSLIINYAISQMKSCQVN